MTNQLMTNVQQSNLLNIIFRSTAFVSFANIQRAFHYKQINHRIVNIIKVTILRIILSSLLRFETLEGIFGKFL